jgi:hypothetical protein
MKKLFLTLTFLLGAGFMALAADDATGTWKGTLETPRGNMENTFSLKVDGDKLTGSLSTEMMGTVQISDGKVDGDKVTFSITTDFGAITYAGTVKGDTLKLTMTAGGGQFTAEINAARVKS